MLGKKFKNAHNNELKACIKRKAGQQQKNIWRSEASSLNPGGYWGHLAGYKEARPLPVLSFSQSGIRSHSQFGLTRRKTFGGRDSSVSHTLSGKLPPL